MARRLHAAGERVAFLGLIDLYRPGLPLKEAKLSRWGRMIAEYDLRNLARAARAKLSRDWGFLSRGVQVVGRRVFRRTVPHELRDFWLTNSFYLAAARYHLEPYAGRVAVFRARGADHAATLRVDPGPDLGWSSMAACGVDARDIPGDHYSLMLEPNVRELARQIEDAIGLSEREAISQVG
jgi:aspartate racemase